ncbi:MAG: hypothetical protein IJD48_00330 [Clostridia bacterium]|nr:hypothetical protein [Clostridia bacterium]
MIENEKNEIIDFINSCNDFIDGKFILADIKIAKLLKLISNSPSLYDLIAECMINYDFQKEYDSVKISEGNSCFTLPKETHKIIPFVFCLLVEIDSKRLNFNEFLKTQFPYANNQNEEYAAFSKNVIIPFRNSIANVFDIEIEQKDYSQEDTTEDNDIIDQKLQQRNNLESENKMQDDKTEHNTIIIQNITQVTSQEDSLLAKIQEEEEVCLLFDRIIRLSRILDDKLSFVRNPLKKSNIGLLIDGLCEACQLKNVKIVVALVMALNTFAGNERSMREEIRELNAICYDFYEQ